MDLNKQPLYSESVSVHAIVNELIPDANTEYKCSTITKSKGFTLLMSLSMHTKENSILNSFLLNYLKQHPEEIDKQNEKGWTALMLAARNTQSDSSIETVKILVDAGANVNLQTNNGCTALMLAARYTRSDSSIETVHLLIDAGARINLQTNDGFTALMTAAWYARSDSSIETVKLLVGAGADLNLQNNNGLTALMLAARYTQNDSNIETVKLLVDAGADISLLNYKGKNVIDLTDDKDQVVKIILNQYESIKKHKQQITELNAEYKQQNTVLSTENKFYRDTLECHPDSVYIEELKKDFMEKASQLQ